LYISPLHESYQNQSANDVLFEFAMASSEINVFSVLFGSTPLKEKPEKIQKAYENWIALQAPAVEGVFSGVFGSMQGAFLGTLMGTMAKGSMAEAQASGAGPTAQMMQMGGPMIQARNFAVMTGTNAGISAFMRRYRKVDDIQNSLVAAFGSGACFSLVSGMGSKPAIPGTTAPNPLMGAFSAGVVFALFQGAFYKLGETWSGPKVEDTEYSRVKAMLTHLGRAKIWQKKRHRGFPCHLCPQYWSGPIQLNFPDRTGWGVFWMV
jgi:hypothetical protein